MGDIDIQEEGMFNTHADPAHLVPFSDTPQMNSPPTPLTFLFIPLGPSCLFLSISLPPQAAPPDFFPLLPSIYLSLTFRPLPCPPPSSFFSPPPSTFG